MIRYKWFNANWQMPLSEIAGNMLMNQYSNDIGYGYDLELSGNNLIRGSFIEKNEFNDIVKDPFGNETIFRRHNYDIVSFELSNSFLSIEIVDFPRKLSGFFSSLGKINNNNTAISNININLDRVLSNLEKKFSNFKVINLNCSGLLVSRTTSAKFYLVSTQDAREDIKKIAQGKSYVINRAVLSCVVNNFNTTVEITNQSSVKLDPRFAGLVIPTIKESIVEGKSTS